MEENNLDTDLAQFLEAAGLQQLLPVFKIGDLDLADLLSLHESDVWSLRRIVDNHTDYEKLAFALTMFSKSYTFGGDTEEGGDARQGNNQSEETLESLLIKNELGSYIPAFQEVNMDLQSLLKATELELKKHVTKFGDWSKLCRVRRQFLISNRGKMNLTSEAEDNSFEFIDIPDQSLEEFLTASRLDPSVYLSLLEAHSIGLRELLDIPNHELKAVVPVLSQWYKLCQAKQIFISQHKNRTGPGPSKVNNINRDLPDHEQKSQNYSEEDTVSVVSDEVDQDVGDDDVFESKESALKKTLNILLLGETGVGKSTLINAFANYLTFETMDEAMKGKILALIPSSFSQTDRNFVHHRVTIGDDANENMKAGQSATQACKSYLFPFQNLSIRVIDTPGIGDVRGVKQDQLNMDNILSFIGQYEDLHGICILLKPDKNRLSTTFSFCIKELLCHLQKDAARNIMFVFTNSRGTFYMPAETAPTLKVILDEIRNNPPYVHIPFNRETIYCYDSEAFRFLMLHNQGLQLQDHETRARVSSESWTVSVKECKRMIRRIASLTPHKVQDTIAIEEARKFITELSKPIADIAQNVQVNLQLIEDKRVELRDANMEMLDLDQKLRVPVVDVEQRVFDMPRTVCTAAKCIEVRMIGNTPKIIHKQKCHDPCFIKGIQPESKGDEALMNCEAMNWDSFTCHFCRCSYKEHMHIYYECVEKESHIEDPVVKAMIQQKVDVRLVIAQLIRTLEERNDALMTERDLLTKTVAKFAMFLKSNAIMAYNDSFKDYVQHLIANERMKMEMAGASNQPVIDGLEQMLRVYVEEKRILDQVRVAGAEDSDASILSPESIHELEEELYAMKINGKRLKMFRDGYRAARERVPFAHAEQEYRLPVRRGRGERKKHWVDQIKKYFF